MAGECLYLCNPLFSLNLYHDQLPSSLSIFVPKSMSQMMRTEIKILD